MGEVGLRGGELAEDMVTEASTAVASLESKARGKRAINEGVSRREDTLADTDDPLLGRVEAGVDGSEVS